VRPLSLVEPLSHLCVPTLLTGVEVSGPKVINIKQYLSRNSFLSNLHKQQNFIRMIEMSRKILILKTFVPKMIFFNPSLKKTEVEHLQKWKKKHRF
jgi:hypothetical protein